MRHAFVDLQDTIASIRDDIEDIEQSQDDLASEAEEKYGSFEETPDPFVATYDALEDRREELEEMADAGEARLDNLEDEPTDEDGWSDTTLQIKELSIGDAAQVQDKTGVQVDGAQDVLEAGEGAATVETLRLSIVKSPDGAPDDAADYPAIIGQLILMEISKLAGMDPMGEDMGKSSLRERMES